MLEALGTYMYLWINLIVEYKQKLNLYISSTTKNSVHIWAKTVLNSTEYNRASVPNGELEEIDFIKNTKFK